MQRSTNHSRRCVFFGVPPPTERGRGGVGPMGATLSGGLVVLDLVAFDVVVVVSS